MLHHDGRVGILMYGSDKIHDFTYIVADRRANLKEDFCYAFSINERNARCS